MKIRCNSLNKENAELQSQLNIVYKHVEKVHTDNKKIVEKYKELKTVCTVYSLMV